MDFLSKAKSSNVRDFLATNNTVVLKFSAAVPRYLMYGLWNQVLVWEYNESYYGKFSTYPG